MKSTLLVSFSLALFSSSLALGATITVPDDYATIQAAIDAAAEGDTIQVRAGEYQEVIDFGVKNLTLESIDGADSTFIGVQSPPTSIVSIVGGQDSSTVFRGFTVRYGYKGTPAPQNPSILLGGGLYTLSSSPTIENCLFTDNKTAFGSGAYVLYGSPSFSNCTFFDNYSTSSGGGLQLFQCSATMNGCLFDDNFAIYDGGGTKIVEGNCVFSDCVFTNNTADEGGGVFWFASTNPTPHSLALLGCSITLNERSSSGFGAGLRTRYGYTLVDLAETTICDNTPDQIYGPFVETGPNVLCVCPADLTGNGEIDGADLGILLAYWGPCAGEPCFPDLNDDGLVDGGDLGLLLAGWGACSFP